VCGGGFGLQLFLGQAGCRARVGQPPGSQRPSSGIRSNNFNYPEPGRRSCHVLPAWPDDRPCVERHSLHSSAFVLRPQCEILLIPANGQGKQTNFIYFLIKLYLLLALILFPVQDCFVPFSFSFCLHFGLYANVGVRVCACACVCVCPCPTMVASVSAGPKKIFQIASKMANSNIANGHRKQRLAKARKNETETANRIFVQNFFQFCGSHEICLICLRTCVSFLPSFGVRILITSVINFILLLFFY